MTFKKGFGYVYENVERRYQFIQEHQQEYPVKTMGSVLCVAESGYDAWGKRVPRRRQWENERLTERIRHAYEPGRQVYGSPRILAELQAHGISCGSHRVARLMCQAGLRAVQK